MGPKVGLKMLVHKPYHCTCYLLSTKPKLFTAFKAIYKPLWTLINDHLLEHNVKNLNKIGKSILQMQYTKLAMTFF
jgi:hypothetical protein